MIQPTTVSSAYNSPYFLEKQKAADPLSKNIEELLKTPQQKEVDEHLNGKDSLKNENTLSEAARYDPLKPCECESCTSRLYQDGSTDAGVSFKSPTHINPSMSTALVSAHEQEHVARAQQKASDNELRVVSANVRLFHRTCSECGTPYCSGGITTVKYGTNVPMYKLMGSNVDKSV